MAGSQFLVPFCMHQLTAGANPSRPLSPCFPDRVGWQGGRGIFRLPALTAPAFCCCLPPLGSSALLIDAPPPRVTSGRLLSGFILSPPPYPRRCALHTATTSISKLTLCVDAEEGGKAQRFRKPPPPQASCCCRLCLGTCASPAPLCVRWRVGSSPPSPWSAAREPRPTV